MSMREFIRANRAAIDAVICRGRRHPESIILNDEERRLWVLNDEGLYRWARSEGVKI